MGAFCKSEFTAIIEEGGALDDVKLELVFHSNVNKFHKLRCLFLF